MKNKTTHRVTLLEAISRTSRQLLALEFFAIGYAWQDKQLGELQATTVVPACDGPAALAHLKSRQPHLTRVWLLQPEATVPEPFTVRRSFLKKEVV